MSRIELTHTRLLHLLHYTPSTGDFVWKVNAGPRATTKLSAGTDHPAGYRRIHIDGAAFYAHRLAWFYVWGEWPIGQIDHINHVKNDNRIENLRVVTAAQNIQNRHLNKNNKSGFKGVSRHACGSWAAEITSGRKKTHLGLYPTPQAAYEAYQAAASRVHTHNPIAKPVPKEILQ